MISQARARELLDYEPATGVFRWRVNRRSYLSKARIGAIAGAPRYDGYVELRIDGELIHAHRLAFLWMEGTLPPEVDHINGDKTDQRWGNLRIATHGQNGTHKGPNKNNKLGVKGVRVMKKKYEARIWRDGRQVVLGYFSTVEEASECYRMASLKQHGEFSYAHC
jgi:hypothetical protein